MLHLAIFGATWAATKLRDKLHEKLPSVTVPLGFAINYVPVESVVNLSWKRCTDQNQPANVYTADNL